MKLWLDDCRKPPFGYDLWAKTADEAIAYLEYYGDLITHCSLDHDLADEHFMSGNNYMSDYLDREKYKEKTGYEVIVWMVQHDKWVPDITVHTMNPTGGKDMINLLIGRAPDGVKFRRGMPYSDDVAPGVE